jgi:membrane associated rhomboid family serine protease
MIPIGVVGKTKFKPYIVYALIFINVVVFVWELYVQSQGSAAFNKMLLSMALNVCSVGVEPLPVVALDSFRSMFLHGNELHLFGNMLFLYVFGSRVEEYFGRSRFLVLYLVLGFIATAGHIFFSGALDSCSPTKTSLVIGASGAIAGVMGAFLFLYPGARVRTIVGLFRPLFWEFKLPAVLFLGYWFVMDFMKGIGWISSIGVANWAHLAGFIGGVAAAFMATLFIPAPKADPFEYLDE